MGLFSFLLHPVHLFIQRTTTALRIHSQRTSEAGTNSDAKEDGDDIAEANLMLTLRVMGKMKMKKKMLVVKMLMMMTLRELRLTVMLMMMTVMKKMPMMPIV